MPVFLKDDVAVLFAHIPKTGGTTLEHAFAQAGWHVKLRETRRKPPTLLPLRRCSPQHFHATLLAEMLRLDRFDLVFTVTRDPVTRFRSEYLMRNRQHPSTDPSSVERWADEVLAKRDSDPYVFDNHLRPQVEFVLPQAVVYRLEDGLDAIAVDLNRRVGAELATPLPTTLDSTSLRGVASSSVQVSASLEQRLRDVYAGDFEQLGYRGS